ncbi:MAG: M23 family metallopeptidase, partial [Candidatus Dormibacteria bacterium]
AAPVAPRAPAPPAATPKPAAVGNGTNITQANLPPITVDPNALLASQAQEISVNSIATQRPDLVHFRPPSTATGASDGDNGALGGRGEVGLLVPLVIAGMAALVLALASLARIKRKPMPSGLRRALAVAPLLGALEAGALALLISGSVGGAPASHSSLAAPAPSFAAGMTLSALRTHSVSTPVGAGSPSWGSLVNIESALTSQQDSLVTDEQTIAAVTPQLKAAAAGSAFTRRPGAIGVLESALRHAVDDHQAMLASFNESLAKEYNFFVDAAHSPETTTELRSVAEHTPPDVENAVTTDLNMVATQLQQEALISAATGTNSLLSQLLTGSGLKFHEPVAGVVSQPFGPTSFALEPPVTYGGNFYPHFHTGLDLAAPMDTPVHASAAGVVVLATSSIDTTGHLAGYGNYVVIAHGDGFITLYGHLDRLEVNPGEVVSTGQEIGLLGSTGWSTGPHVHFEIRKNGVYTDPYPYIADELGR